MKLKDLIATEKELVDMLMERARAGDNGAADVLLQHLQRASKAIEEWRKGKDAEKTEADS